MYVALGAANLNKNAFDIPNITTSTGNFSCAYWLRYGTSMATNARFWWFLSGGQNVSNRCLYTTGATNLSSITVDQFSGTYYNTPSPAIAPNVWTHLAMTYTKSTSQLLIYRNATLASTITQTALGVSSGTITNFSICPTENNTNGYGINGYMDDFRFYVDTVLTASQISDIYSST